MWGAPGGGALSAWQRIEGCAGLDKNVRADRDVRGRGGLRRGVGWGVYWCGDHRVGGGVHSRRIVARG